MSARKKSFLFIAILLVLFFAVAIYHRKQKSLIGLQKQTIHIQNMDRTFYVHVPTLTLPGKGEGRENQPIPLLIAFHGRLGTGPGMSKLTHLNEVADRRHFLVAYPDGYERSWADGRGKTKADTDHIDDLGFVKEIIHQLSAQYRIKNIYAAGMSNGGFFSLRLACEMSDTFTAVEPVAATLSEATSLRCKPKNPVSVLMIMGTQDPLVPFNGGEMSGSNHPKILSAQDSFKRWSELDGCEGQPQQKSISKAVQVQSYDSCKNGTHVTLYTIQGGGHTWPGGEQYLPEMMVGKTNRDFDAGELFANLM